MRFSAGSVQQATITKSKHPGHDSQLEIVLFFDFVAISGALHIPVTSVDFISINIAL